MLDCHNLFSRLPLRAIRGISRIRIPFRSTRKTGSSGTGFKPLLSQPWARGTSQFYLSGLRPAVEALEARQLLSVVISEFMADNEAALADENGDYSDWIELFNPGPAAQDLSGWYLTDTASNLTKWRLPQTSLTAGQHLLVFASGKDRAITGRTLHTNFKLERNGEYLGLVRPDGVTVEFAYAPQFPPQSNDVSYGLAGDLVRRGYFPQSTPGLPNQGDPIPESAGAVLISEIMYSLPRTGILDAENTDEEFIELYNRGFRSVDVTGWRFTRGVDYVLPAGTIPPQGYLVVAADPTSFARKYPGVTAVIGGWTGTLSNRSETIELVDALGNLVDRVRYASEGDWGVRARGPDDRGYRGWIWASAHDGGGKSLELVQANLPNDFGQNWAASVPDGGTPGRANSAARTDVAPLILDARHDPPVPASGQPVNVSAQLLDELTTGLSATLLWRIDGRPNFTRVPMLDDGEGPDPQAGDGVYWATIPGQPDGTVVEFFIESSDAAVNRRTWPAPDAEGEQQTNALYQVLDAYADTSNWTPGSAPIYLQIMTGAERNEFTALNQRAPLSNAQYNATIIFITGADVDIRYTAGVRVRGSGSRGDNPPNNRINLPNDRPWQGVAHININHLRPDNQIAASALFRLAGLAALDVVAVRMISNGVDLNNGQPYAHIEALDNEFAERHFAGDGEGNVYVGRRADESPPGGRGAGLAYFGPDPAPYVSYTKQTNASQADWSDVIELTNRLNNAPDSTYVQDIQQVVNVDQWLRNLAMHAVVDNNEFGLPVGDAQGDDYAMYRGVVDPRFQLLPYDLDTVFENTQRGLFRMRGVPALNRLLNQPEFLRRYYAQLLDLVDNVVLTDTARVTLEEALRNVGGSRRVDQIWQYLQGRRNFIRSQIPQQLVVNAALPNVGGWLRSNVPTISLTGSAPLVETRQVTINGQPAQTLLPDGTWAFGSGSFDTEALVPSNADWRYLDDGSDQGTSWRDPGFSDSGWNSGPAPLGYGDGDEATVVNFVDVDPAAGGVQENATTYFRRTFSLDDPGSLIGLSVRLQYDDAAAVYINGQEAIRTDNLPPDAQYNTYATSTRSNENEIVDFVVPDTVLKSLVPGENTVAVEIHQAGPNSSDISFQLELVGSRQSAAQGLGLSPGVNRLLVQAWDQSDGTGTVIASQSLDIWYDDGTVRAVNGTINADQVWSAASGPYQISGDVTVVGGTTLTIEPGTTVFFEPGARLTVRGRLVAMGQPSREVRFTRTPGSTDPWNGIQFVGSTVDNRIEYAILEYGVTDDGMVGLENSNLTLDHVTFDRTDLRRIRSIDSSLIVRNSTFTNIADPGQAPATDNRSEHIWGRGIPSNGRWIIENNVFGHTTGHNDAIDFDSARLPDPIAVVRNNVFVGGGDDAMDMTGDVWIEGNVFRNFHRDRFNTAQGNSNAISSSGGDYWVLRNVFDSMEHVAQVKENAFMHFLYNTVVDATFPVLYFDRPGQTAGPGRGARVEGSIFPPSAVLFDEVLPTTQLSVSYSLVPADYAGLGPGNRVGFANVAGVGQDYALLSGSPARGAGPAGLDLGARVPPGAAVAGEPAVKTTKRSAELTVAGPAITHYRYRVNQEAFSSELPVSQPIQLTNLADGTYTVSVIGKNALGEWQDPDDAAASGSWTVAAAGASGRVRINEVLAWNVSAFAYQETFPDFIELYNDGDAAVDLSGMSITDDRNDPDKFVFPAGTLLGPGEYLTLFADSNRSLPGLHLGFALETNGEGVWLFDRPAAGQTLLDSVQFGLQLPDRSIGRIGPDAEWALTQSTPGQPNVPQPLGDPSGLKINEWYARGRIRVANDYLELYNPDPLPVDLSGLILSDSPTGLLQEHIIPTLSFVAARGFARFVADGQPEDGAHHLSFRLSELTEHLVLADPSHNPIDQVIYYPQTREVSQGRAPDGTAQYQFSTLPTPGTTNGQSSSRTEVIAQLDWGQVWRYDASGDNLGTAWRAPDFDDSGWSTGSGPLGNENEPLPVPLQTQIPLGHTTYYFRTHFTLDADPATVTTQFLTTIDDGVVVYVNGTEVRRLGMGGGNIRSNTLANRPVNEAVIEGPFDIPPSVLVRGDNLIAAELHQNRTDSTDIVFGLSLTASRTVTSDPDRPIRDLMNGLRITELMYHPPNDQSTEYVELQNVGETPLDLRGVRLEGAVEFVFPAIALAPQQRVVVTENTAAFTARYGANLPVVGMYTGRFSNGGEQIVLRPPAPYDAAILRFEYHDRWYPTTDGQGLALEIVDASRGFDTWELASSWQAAVPSPGRGSVGTRGDFNSDGRIDAQDIQLLCQGIRQNDAGFDMDQDGQLGQSDLGFMIQVVLGTNFGDANLDGAFNSGDLIRVFQVGEFEDAIAGNSTWGDGDWNCDGEFDTGDLVVAFQAGGYERAAVAALTDWRSDGEQRAASVDAFLREGRSGADQGIDRFLFAAFRDRWAHGQRRGGSNAAGPSDLELSVRDALFASRENWYDL